MLVDIHSHLNDDKFAADREEIARTLEAEGIITLTVGTDKKHSKEAVRLAEIYDKMFATVGLHPADNIEEGWDYEWYKELAKSEKVVAIGECGLDYHWVKDEAKREEQKKVFVEQVKLACELGKPLMLHVRSERGSDKAYEDALEILDEHNTAKVGANFHFFAGSLEVARKIWERGYSTSFTGVLTFTNDYDEVVRGAPENLIMAETDAPYVAPAPHRGKRAEVAHVKEVLAKMAELRGIDIEAMEAQNAENARKAFNLPI